MKLHWLLIVGVSCAPAISATLGERLYGQSKLAGHVWLTFLAIFDHVELILYV